MYNKSNDKSQRQDINIPNDHHQHHHHHAPSNSFYNLQMYSSPSLYTTNTQTPPPVLSTPIQPHQKSAGLYQNLHEVPYHNPSSSMHTPRSASPAGSSSSSSASMNNYATRTAPPQKQSVIQKNGITFTDPFYSANDTHFRGVSSSSETTAPVTVLQPLYATFGPESIFITCPYCHHTDLTDVEKAIGSKSLLWACIIPCFGFLRSSKRDTRHRCKNCLNVIGIHYP